MFMFFLTVVVVFVLLVCMLAYQNWNVGMMENVLAHTSKNRPPDGALSSTSANDVRSFEPICGFHDDLSCMTLETFEPMLYL